MQKYHVGLTLSDALSDNELRSIVMKHMPRAGKGFLYRRIKDVPLEQLLQRVSETKRREKLSALIAELKQR